MRKWNNAMMMLPDSEDGSGYTDIKPSGGTTYYSDPVVPVTYVDPLLKAPLVTIDQGIPITSPDKSPTLDEILAQIAGYESDIANLIVDPMPIDISFGNTSLNPAYNLPVSENPVVPVTYVDPRFTPNPTGTVTSPDSELPPKPTTIKDVVDAVLETIAPTTEPVTTPTTTTVLNKEPVTVAGVGQNIVDTFKGTIDSIFSTEGMSESDKNQLYMLGALAGIGILALIFNK